MGFWGSSVIPMDSDGIMWFLCDPNGIHCIPRGSQWIPMAFWGFSVISMDPNGILWFLWDPNGILGFLHDPTGSQWDFGVSL